ncbi:hypothetical protein NDU88_005658 [Pleurodeles waltl]|uniref:Uncharacterized protein n=1 Tax=Pleurodeles waltl TaxID=8319 RepID=A0AAV7VME9_PLEWA|nr:hypothetical protein NDU88_005658 [Pleurodeles waltl]
MEQYITPTPQPQRQNHTGGSGEALAVPAAAGKPTRTELLDAIHGTRVAQEGKIETVAVKVNLLRADLRKVSDKAKVAEGVLLGGLASVWLALLEWMVWTGGDVEMACHGSLCSDVMTLTLSRIEIQQDGTMAIVDPKQVVELAGSLDVEAEQLSVDS